MRVSMRAAISSGLSTLAGEAGEGLVGVHGFSSAAANPPAPRSPSRPKAASHSQWPFMCSRLRRIPWRREIGQRQARTFIITFPGRKTNRFLGLLLNECVPVTQKGRYSLACEDRKSTRMNYSHVAISYDV